MAYHNRKEKKRFALKVGSLEDLEGYKTGLHLWNKHERKRKHKHKNPGEISIMLTLINIPQAGTGKK